MPRSLPSIDQLVMHRGPMLLLGHLLEASDTHAVGEVVIAGYSNFFKEGHGVPAYVGLEYMAQTIAAFDGARRLETGEAPSIGLLLGTRRYSSKVDFFPAGMHLSIRVDMVFRNGSMASFDCIISSGEEELVSASLNVYRPENGEMTMPGDRA